MAVFREPWNEQSLDWLILQNGPVALYHRHEIMDGDIEWFRGTGYDVFSFDCSGWKSESDFHSGIASGLAFPSYYGRNLDAFNDCLSDLEIRDDAGVLIVFVNYDTFVEVNRSVAWNILDVLAEQSRVHSLLGRRLITLVQSDDPAIDFDPVGACPVLWNPKEWLNEERGL